MTTEAGAKPIAEMTFEEALRELEAVVDALEKGDVPLEESITLYERGDALRRHCEAKLREAELRVEKIVTSAEGEAIGTEPFDEG